jgi:hypothetical protein
MSQASLDIVREFFALNNFFILKKKDVLVVKNTALSERKEFKRMLLGKEDITSVKNAVVKVISWHTSKFTPSVMEKSPEIFDFLSENFLNGLKKLFEGEDFLKILVIPALPSSKDLYKASENLMRGKGINHVMTFPSVISGLIDKIQPRHVYMSYLKELFRVLKFYRFVNEDEQELPFGKK